MLGAKVGLDHRMRSAGQPGMGQSFGLVYGMGLMLVSGVKGYFLLGFEVGVWVLRLSLGLRLSSGSGLLCLG